MTLEPHRRELVALAYRITGDHGAAEDLVQDAFVVAPAEELEVARSLVQDETVLVGRVLLHMVCSCSASKTACMDRYALCQVPRSRRT